MIYNRFMDKLYTFKETMEILRLSRVSIYRLINKGDIKPIKLSGKVLFLEEDIQALIDRLKKKR